MAVKKNPGPKLFFSQFGGEQPIPPEFIAAMEREEEIQAVPDDVGPEELSDTIVESKVETNRTDERVRRTVKKKPGNVGPLLFIQTNEQGQPVQVSRLMFPTGTTPAPPTATDKVGVVNLGNGWSIQEVGVEGTYIGGVFTPAVFPRGEYSTEIPDPLPPEFAVVAPISTSEVTVEGTVDTTPDLATGNLVRRESQITQFLKRVFIRTRAPVGDGTLVQTETADGIIATVTRVFATGIQTATTAYLTLRSQVKNLGNNTSLKETVTVAAFPTKQGQDRDRKFAVTIPYTIDRKVMGDDIGDANKEITPVDFVRADVKEVDLTALGIVLEAFALEFPGRTNLDLPNVLVSVTAYMDPNVLEGDYDETGNAAATGGHGTISLGLRGSGQSSASYSAAVIPIIDQPWAKKVKTRRFVFFLPSPVTIAAIIAWLEDYTGDIITDWPKFHPKGHTIVAVAHNVSIRADARVEAFASFSTSDSSAAAGYTEGQGTSYEVGSVTRETSIPPCIHGELTVTGAGTDTSPVASIADVDITGDVDANGHAEAAGEARCEIFPGTLAATSGATAIPSSGVFLNDCDAEPYLENFIMIEAELVDAADI